MKHLLPALFAGLLTTACAEIPDVVRLWPAAAPGSEKVALAEKITERSRDPQHPDRIYTEILEPSLKVYRPAQPNGAAVIIASGGGYRRIVIDKEGPDTAAWLNRQGITAFVLKYRLPNEGHVKGHLVPLQDAQRAMRVLRANARAWGLDPARIGFLGYSAGGHVAVALTFYFDQPVYPAVDEADALSSRPDFSVLGYAVAGLRGEPPDNVEGLPPYRRLMWEYRARARPGVSYPPTFILHADDDPTVPSTDAATIYLALKEAGTPAELHVFKRGKHGFGIRDAQGPVAQWPDLCAAWLQEIGILK